MSDLISRQDALGILAIGEKLLKRLLDEVDVVGYEREKYEWGLGLIESYISDMKDLPSAEPERKKGKWIDDTYCDQCGWTNEVESGFIGSVKGFNFCPNCGADMRDKEDEE